jgi:hypothetical protein
MWTPSSAQAPVGFGGEATAGAVPLPPLPRPRPRYPPLPVVDILVANELTLALVAA